MYCWGSSTNGELGLGASQSEQVVIPEANEFSSSWEIKQIAAGLTHTLFLTDEGKVFSCGNNDFGQLGHNKITRRPEHIDALEGFTITQVCCGDQHSLALTSWGMIYSWGENGFGQLGLNSIDSQINSPKLVKSLAHKQIAQLASGSNHSFALTLDGEIFGWGLNNSGQLGLKHADSPVREPRRLSQLMGVPIRYITAGGHHSLALTEAGFLLSWGSNKYGQLGRSLPAGEIFSAETSIIPNLATYSEPLKYVSAGENHTAALDSYGKLWTFGYGRYGQLGHGSFEDSSMPRPVLDLVGSKVTQVACGRCHTIAYLPSQGQLHAFGQGMSGQLGIKTPQNKSLPQVVIGPWRTPSGKMLIEQEVGENYMVYIKKVFAGGEGSFACVSKVPNSSPDYTLICPYNQIYKLEEEKINALLAVSDDNMIDDDLFSYSELSFGSLSCWNGSFLKVLSSKRSGHGIDYRTAEEFIGKLGRITRSSLAEVVNLGITRVIRDIPHRPVTEEVLRIFILLPLWKGFADIKNSRSFQAPFAKALLTLDKSSFDIFKSWLHFLPLDYLRLFLSHYKKVTTYIIISQKSYEEFKPLSCTLEDEKGLLVSSLQILEIIYMENKKFLANKAHMTYDEFYIPEITENIDLRKDYINWLQDSVNQVCFCRYSFLFDSKAKTLVLRADATRQMEGAMTDAFTSNIFMWMVNPTQVQFLNLHVHRDQLLTDTLNQLCYQKLEDLKKPLKVHFIGEEADDAGGVRKEFFLLLLRDLLNPDFGMFTEFKESNIVWFRHGSLEADEMYSLIGIICGLAIYNFTIVNLPFPLAIYKKLLEEPVSLDDLFEMDPILGKNLEGLLNYEGHDIEDVFCLNFTVTQDNFGEALTIPLKPDGDQISVTNANKGEYVDLIVDWYLSKGIERGFKAFHEGFMRVCGGGILKLFQPIELQALVTGNENYDWVELQKNTKYKGVYHSKHQVIIYFWEVFHELSLDQKKDFLMFLTGTSRIPILGMKAIPMAIQSTNDINYLPVAHTCVAQLDLPQYNTKEKLRYKLLQAIQQSEGFGLV